MVEEYINPNLEVPEEELVEQLSSDEERLEPLDTRATSVSETDWADQQIDASFDEDDEPEE
ncbi:MAG TPA: hypothetical protein H9822_11435 [Candidatus Yaniella excrementavium]|nr:hypothetical protein [Candidatus Yaniella excrementavium]